ncbi:MAG: hypothetical protein ACUVWP_08820 [bacterium]
MLRYIFAAAIKPIRLIGWLATLALSVIFLNPFIGIGGTIGYVIIIVIDCNRGEFRRLVDRKYRIAALGYHWRREAKELEQEVETVKAIFKRSPGHLRHTAVSLEVSLDSALNDGLSLIESADQIDALLKVQSNNKALEKALVSVSEEIEKFKKGIEKASATAILAISKPITKPEEALTPLRTEIDMLSKSLKQADLALRSTLDSEGMIEKEFKKLEKGKGDK